MEFKDAFTMLKDLHEQNGDRDIVNMRPEFELATKRYKTFDEYANALNSRSDLSQDMKWEIECWIETLRVLFKLMEAK